MSCKYHVPAAPSTWWPAMARSEIIAYIGRLEAEKNKERDKIVAAENKYHPAKAGNQRVEAPSFQRLTTRTEGDGALKTSLTGLQPCH